MNANEQAAWRKRMADLQAAQDAAASERATRAAANLKAELDAQADVARARRRSVMSLEELAADAPVDELIPTDEEIAALGDEFGMSRSEWVARLKLFIDAQQTA